MITFASLFLGLIVGVRPVEVVVGEPVARVEFLLDGERAALLEGPPWVAPVDFGSELVPRTLEAVAYDARQGEVGRVRQWLNLPQPAAVLGAVLEPHEPGKPRVALLRWESSAGAEPTEVRATLDGQPLRVDDPNRLELPLVDESQLHLLQVEMDFGRRATSRIDLTFGGSYIDEVSTEITAIPLWATGRRPRAPTIEQIRGWFVKEGEPLPVIAVERGKAELLMVMARPFPYFALPGEKVKIPKSLDLGDDLQLRFLSTTPQESQGVATTFELFPISPAYDHTLVGDLYSMLTGLVQPPPKGEPNPTAAVAVAGLAAYEGRQRRAVILVPPSWDGESNLTATQVRRYLESLRVPLEVWRIESGGSSHLAEWGEVRAAGSMKDLAKAYEDLVADLERQWVVWIDGRHLPQDIELAEGFEGWSLER